MSATPSPKGKLHPFQELLGVILVLNLLDLCITTFAISAGYAEEMNPIMGYFLNNSFLSFALFKIFVMQYALLVEIARYQKSGRHSKKLMWGFLIVVYGGTVIWNVITVSLHAAGIF
jgi:hypothetical protein